MDTLAHPDPTITGKVYLNQDFIMLKRDRKYMGFLTNVEIEEGELTFVDQGSERVQRGYELEPDGFRIAWAQHDAIGHLQLAVMGASSGESVDETLFNQKATYMIYDWIATHIRERALVLGCKAEYMVGRVLLRVSLEAQMTGVLMNSLANEEFREAFREELDQRHHKEIQRMFGASNPWEVINKIELEDMESTARILDIINESENQSFHDLSNGIVRDTLAECGYFEPKPKGEIRNCYDRLNSSVHANISKSVVERSLHQHGHPFESPSHSKEEFQEFLEDYFAVLDIEGVLMLNEFESVIDRNEELRDGLTQFTSSLSPLEDTQSKLTQLAGS